MTTPTSERRTVSIGKGQAEKQFEITATPLMMVEIRINGVKVTGLYGQADWDRIKDQPQGLEREFGSYLI